MPDDENSDLRAKSDKQQSNSNQPNGLGAVMFVSQMGATIIICVAVGLAAGYYLDKLLGTSPWLLLVFTLLGIAAAFKSIFDFAKKQ